ncbi:hypothetical protein [Sorangium sp. So ce1078]|uniref:hypothetical protein n=1 Tax=Sorangium sp. So ce1078 TaxID=3133329 RepID=UPI003F62A952
MARPARSPTDTPPSTTSERVAEDADEARCTSFTAGVPSPEAWALAVHVDFCIA